MNVLKDSLLELNEYKKMVSYMQSEGRALCISGLTDAQKSHLISSINTDKTKIIITHNYLKAKEIYEDLLFPHNA